MQDLYGGNGINICGYILNVGKKDLGFLDGNIYLRSVK